MAHENARNYGHHRIFTVVSFQKKNNLTNVKNIAAKRLMVVVVVTMEEEEEKEALIEISVPSGLTSV